MFDSPIIYSAPLCKFPYIFKPIPITLTVILVKKKNKDGFNHPTNYIILNYLSF